MSKPNLYVETEKIKKNKKYAGVAAMLPFTYFCRWLCLVSIVGIN